MDVVRTIPAGQKGSIRYLKEWGDKLLNVRYRRDEHANEMVTTIEIIMDRRPLPKPGTQQRGYLIRRNEEPVAIRAQPFERELHTKIKQAGGRWSRQLSLWILRRKAAVQLGLLERIVDGAAEKCVDVDTSLLR